MSELPAKDPISQYRDKFESLDQCLMQLGTSTVILVNGASVRFNTEDSITEAHENGIISEATFDKYQEA